MRRRQRSAITGPNGALLEYPLSTARFIAPLRNTLAPSAGYGPATFTRTTTASFFDNEGMLKEVRAGAARFTGARRVANLIPASEHDSAWSAAGSTPPTVNAAATHLGKNCVSVTIPAGVSGYSTCRADGAPFTVTTGRTYTLSYLLAANRPLIAGEEIYVYITGSAGLCTITFNSTTTNPATQWRNYEVTSTNASGTGSDRFTVTPKTNLASPITIYVAERQCEDVTGQTVQTASEYVHSGRVRSNYLTYTEDFTASGWANANTTIENNALANPVNGLINATKFTAASTAATAVYTNSNGSASSSGMTFSVYGKKGSGTSDCNRFVLYNATTTTSVVSTTINWDTGEMSNPSNSTAVSVGDGWYLITLFSSTGFSNGDNARVYVGWSGGTETVGEFAYIYGPTLVRGVVASPTYTPVGADYDPHGSGVDGVKYFNTNKDGTPIPQTFNKGYLNEGARTNNLLWCRDLTNAAWVKTTMTTALTSTGIDGQASSATRLTATAANAQCLQTFTMASAARTFSAYVKRITGTGTVEITRDNGTSWTDITSLISTSGYTRVTIAGTSVTNPTCGFRIVTSGNAIDVDYCQDEAGSFPSNPIATTTVSVTRNSETLSYPTEGNLNNPTGTLLLSQRIANVNNSGTIRQISTGISISPLYKGNSGNRLFSTDGTLGVGNIPWATDTNVNKACIAWNTNYRALSLNGSSVDTNNSYDGSWDGFSFYIGSSTTGTENVFGNVSNVYLWPTALSDMNLKQITA